MRLTDFWQRMESALGVGYCRSWAADFHLAELAGRTVDQALADGEEAVVVWRAVHKVLQLPANQR